MLDKELKAAAALNVTLVHGDILRTDLERLFSAEIHPLVVMGNLPYHISSQVLIQLIHQRRFIKKAVLMFQKELAERLICAPGSRQYGRISVMLNYCASVEKIVSVPPQCFFPQPKVHSQALKIAFFKTSKATSVLERRLFEVIKAAFSKRRKTLLNALAQSNLAIDSSTLKAALIRSGIDPSRRAETLTAEEFIVLTRQLL